MNNVPPHNIVQSNEIIELLKNSDALTFLTEHFNERPDYLSLKYSDKVNFNLTKLTQILHSYQKAQHKIPIWVEKRCAMNAKSFAQSSHWKVALYKSTLFSGGHLLDLTGGLGVDSYYYSKVFKQVTCVERDEITHQFAAYNSSVLDTENIDFVHEDLVNFKFDKNYDLIYIDPDRRLEDQRLHRDLTSYAPNIIEWIPKWLKHTTDIAIKLSPMIDISFLENNIPNLVTTHVISYKNDVKEILIHLKRDYSGEPNRTAVDILASTSLTFSGGDKHQINLPVKHGSFLIEPSKALIKSGLAGEYCNNLGLHPTHSKGLYFMSDETINEFQGRQFLIITALDCNWKAIKKYLKQQNITAIQITQRHFFDDVKTIRKKIGIKEGGETFLQFTVDAEGKGLCYHSSLVLH
jgi:16S rRNA G966 N2-methylase RsmD